MKAKYIIRYEKMGGTWYYMIYKGSMFGYSFLERWNSPENATERLEELINQ